MKQFIFITTVLAAMVLFGCKENPYMPSPGENNKQILDTMPILKADTNGIIVSVDSAYAIGLSCKTMFRRLRCTRSRRLSRRLRRI